MYKYAFVWQCVITADYMYLAICFIIFFYLVCPFLVSCPAPSNAKSEKGSGLPCMEPVSPVQPTVRANQMQEQNHMTAM